MVFSVLIAPVVFTFDPRFAISVDFLLPDGNGAFEFAYEPFASCKGSLAVRCGNRYHDASVTDLEFAEPVNNGYVRDLKIASSMVHDPPHLFDRHLVICFVDQI